jgi:hypothetical protein
MKAPPKQGAAPPTRPRGRSVISPRPQHIGLQVQSSASKKVPRASLPLLQVSRLGAEQKVHVKAEELTSAKTQVADLQQRLAKRDADVKRLEEQLEAMQKRLDFQTYDTRESGQTDHPQEGGLGVESDHSDRESVDAPEGNNKLMTVRTKRLHVGSRVMVKMATGWMDGQIFCVGSEGHSYEVDLENGERLLLPHYRLAAVDEGPSVRKQTSKTDAAVAAEGKNETSSHSIKLGDSVMVRLVIGEANGYQQVSATYAGSAEDPGMVKVLIMNEGGTEETEMVVPAVNVAPKLRLRRQKLQAGTRVLCKNTDGSWEDGLVVGQGGKPGEYVVTFDDSASTREEPFYKLRVVGTGAEASASASATSKPSRKAKLVKSQRLQPGDFVMARLSGAVAGWNVARIKSRCRSKPDGSKKKVGRETRAYDLTIADGTVARSIPFTSIRLIDKSSIDALSAASSGGLASGEKHTLKIRQRKLALNDKVVIRASAEGHSATTWRVGAIERLEGGGKYTVRCGAESISGLHFKDLKLVAEVVGGNLNKAGGAHMQDTRGNFKPGDKVWRKVQGQRPRKAIISNVVVGEKGAPPRYSVRYTPDPTKERRDTAAPSGNMMKESNVPESELLSRSSLRQPAFAPGETILACHGSPKDGQWKLATVQEQQEKGFYTVAFDDQCVLRLHFLCMRHLQTTTVGELSAASASPADVIKPRKAVKMRKMIKGNIVAVVGKGGKGWIGTIVSRSARNEYSIKEAEKGIVHEHISFTSLRLIEVAA